MSTINIDDDFAGTTTCAEPSRPIWWRRGFGGLLMRMSCCAVALSLALLFMTDNAQAAPPAPEVAKGAAAAPSTPAPTASAVKPAEPNPGESKPDAVKPNAADAKPAGTYEKAAKVLFVAFGIALFLESALAAVFNWRPFVQTFVRGTRTVVAFAVSLVLILMEPRLDVFSKLVDATVDPPASDLGFVGKIMSALMLAGGSAGINTLLVALGFRTMRTAESVVAKPPPTEAWVSVRVAEQPPGELVIFMESTGKSAGVIGQINGTSPAFAWLRYFIRDKGRFPTSGGYAIPSGQKYSFVVKTRADKELFRWGPFDIAAGAIIDIEFNGSPPKTRDDNTDPKLVRNN